MFATPNCLQHVATKESASVCTVIHFWLLLTQPVSVTTTASDNNNNYYDIAFSGLLRPPHVGTAEFDARQQFLQQLLLPRLPLMDKALTYCDTSKGSTNWQPVCATTNSVDYVLFSSECLWRQTNRMQGHVSYTGETEPVFKKIAMGLCRPNCSIAIFESNDEPICAQNLRNDEVRLFSGRSEMARDMCLHENEWHTISDAACINIDGSPIIQALTSSKKNALQHTTTTSMTAFTQPRSEHKHSIKLKKQTKKVLRKSIPCPKIFNPVCAELFGVKATFINECLVNAENVKFGKNWQISSKGVCAEDYASSERYKNIIKKRTISDSATVTYKLHTPHQMGLNDGKILWTPNNVKHYYLNSNVKDVYGRHSSSTHQYTVRILPAVDDRVTECRFGVGPVCASSCNRTVHEFENICELMLRNFILNETWSVVNEKKCESEKCILNCPTNYDPFCVSRNGINYTIINQCHVDHAFCRSKQSNLKILGKGECKHVLENIVQLEKESVLIKSTQTSSNPKGKYGLRLARKIFESSAKQGDLSNSLLQSSRLDTITESSVEFVIVPKAAVQSSSESSLEGSTSSTLNTTTATIKPNGTEKDSVSESHIMFLWRSSKMKSDK
ncbi:uncharacterized protein [Eurosta solidaginis]|uniref:uncharacterized protein n=1 Tax=Eurosta solidaginis TaxID=178769 RepID=UPI0035305D22